MTLKILFSINLENCTDHLYLSFDTKGPLDSRTVPPCEAKLPFRAWQQLCVEVQVAHLHGRPQVYHMKQKVLQHTHNNFIGKYSLQSLML
jgi:hypothetical protein